MDRDRSRDTFREVGTGAAVAAVAAGGVAGALARHAAQRAWPAAPDAIPWATVGINVLGSALIGVLMVVVGERRRGHPVLAPLLGAGVLGGFTTFSAYAVDLRAALADGRADDAALYGAVTVAASLAAVWVGVLLARRVVPAR